MSRHLLVPILLLVGLVLLVVGMAWNRVSSSETYWTDEQAKEYAAAQTELHSQWEKRKSRSQSQQSTEFEAAKNRFMASHDALENARTSRSLSRTVLIGAGVTAILAGITLHLAARGSS